MIALATVVTATALAGQTAVPQTGQIVAELRSGRYAEARQMIERAVKDSPGNATLWTLNGFALSHLGDQGEALASYQRALKLSPAYLPALEGAAQILFAASDQEAVPLLKRIVARNPKDETSHAMLATLAFKRKDCDAATSEFRLSRTVIDSQPSTLEQFGACLLQRKQADEALPVFQRVLELRPETEEAQYDLGMAQLSAKRYQDAVHTLKKLVAQKPADADALDLLAEAYEEMGDTADAVATLRQAIVTKPDVPQYYLDFADICMTHTAYKVGIDMLSAGLQRLPQAADLYLARGIFYVQLDDFENSRKDFDRAAQLDPRMEYGQGIQGLADLQQNQLTKAEADVRSRLRTAPRDAFLWYLLSLTLVREGASAGTPPFQEAVSSAERAVALRADFPLARNLLGRLYLEENKVLDAVEQSRLALQEAPTGETAATALYHLVQALKRGGDTNQAARLSKQLAALLQETRAKQASERRYALVEADRPEEPKQ